MTLFRNCCFAAASVCGLMVGLSAQEAEAQTSASPAAPTARVNPIEEVVVTAQRREERLSDVPVAASVVTGEALAKANITSLQDLSRHLPNVIIQPAVLVESINIRGIGSGNNVGFEQSVGTFVDGIYRQRSRAARAAFLDVERVEVLKGPQSTFFGANSIAGALNITTRKPGDDFGYNFSTLYGWGAGSYEVAGGVDLPASDTLKFRIAGRVSGTRGYVDNDLFGKGPDGDDQQGRISVRWEPTANFRSDFRLDAGRSRVNNAYPFELMNCPVPAPFPTVATSTCSNGLALAAVQHRTLDSSLNYHTDSPRNFANYNFYEGAWTNALEVGGGTLTATTGYFTHKYIGEIQQVPFAMTLPVPSATSPFPLLPQERYFQASQELRFQSATGGVFEYMFGGYISRSHLQYIADAGLFYSAFGGLPAVVAASGGAVNGTTPIDGHQNFPEYDTTKSVFASATIRPFDGFRVNLGGRYTSVHKKAFHSNTIGSFYNEDGSTYVPFSPAVQAALAVPFGTDLFDFPQPTRTDSKFMPSVGVQYDVAHNVMAYATWSRGFKAGGYNLSGRALTFNPETVDAYEIGLKGTYFDRTLLLNADVFQSDYKDLQQTTIIFSGVNPQTIVGNAAQARSKGIEANAVWRVSNTVTLTADVARLDAKFVSYPNGSCTILGSLAASTGVPGSGCVLQDLGGKRLPFAPKYSGNLGADIVIPRGEYQFTIDPSVYFTGGFFTTATADPMLRQKGYAKIDLHIGYGPADGRWELAFIGKNLNDKTTASYRQALTGTSGSTIALPDAPRTVAVQFSIKQ